MTDLTGRIKVIYIIIIAAFVCICLRLFYLQIIRGEEYKKASIDKTVSTFVSKAPRGDITDRFGRVLVTDTPEYNLCLYKNSYTDDELDREIEKIITVLKKYNIPLSYTLPDDAVSKYGVDANLDLIGIRYKYEKEIFSGAVDISGKIPDESVDLIRRELKDCQSADIVCKYKRTYLNEGYATHVLGTVGRISQKEYIKYKPLGYGMNEYIGKQGAEKLAESYLRGEDGYQGDDTKDTVQGNRVMLTIDFEMQKVLENSLDNVIKTVSLKNGGSISGGAAVVLDVNSGEILAMASYPTYSAEDISANYNYLIEDKSLPLLNRAVSGVYSPGSTFKPLVALAALENKVITPDTLIEDMGVYSYYDDYRPRCWVWSEKNTTHGKINVLGAIEKSCNYFFYEIGRITGIDNINKMAQKFGFGEYTGTDLVEEAKGTLASPKSKKNFFKDNKYSGWYGADTLQASIGQSIQQYTPVQLANYISILANGGTKYKLNIIKSVVSTIDKTIIEEPEATVVDKIDIDSKNLKAVHEGMKNVIEEGSAKSIFEDYHVEVGGKTGTVQVGKGEANNALFVAFAPFKSPEIAVCVVLEHGVSGANAAYVVKDVFDYYFR